MALFKQIKSFEKQTMCQNADTKISFYNAISNFTMTQIIRNDLETICLEYFYIENLIIQIMKL